MPFVLYEMVSEYHIESLTILEPSLHLYRYLLSAG